MTRLDIVLIVTDENSLAELASATRGISAISVRKAERVHYTRPPSGLDALFLVVPAAEKWGAKPILEAQILKTSLEDQRNGMPFYVIAGGVLRQNDPRNPANDARSVIRAAVDAIHEFNLANKGSEIRSLGFWAVNLLNDLTPEQLSAIFAEIV
jgi:hypothetical protein